MAFTKTKWALVSKGYAGGPNEPIRQWSYNGIQIDTLDAIAADGYFDPLIQAEKPEIFIGDRIFVESLTGRSTLIVSSVSPTVTTTFHDFDLTQNTTWTGSFSESPLATSFDFHKDGNIAFFEIPAFTVTQTGAGTVTASSGVSTGIRPVTDLTFSQMLASDNGTQTQVAIGLDSITGDVLLTNAGATGPNFSGTGSLIFKSTHLTWQVK